MKLMILGLAFMFMVLSHGMSLEISSRAYNSKSRPARRPETTTMPPTTVTTTPATVASADIRAAEDSAEAVSEENKSQETSGVSSEALVTHLEIKSEGEDAKSEAKEVSEKLQVDPDDRVEVFAAYSVSKIGTVPLATRNNDDKDYANLEEETRPSSSVLSTVAPSQAADSAVSATDLDRVIIAAERAAAQEEKLAEIRAEPVDPAVVGSDAEKANVSEESQETVDEKTTIPKLDNESREGSPEMKQITEPADEIATGTKTKSKGLVVEEGEHGKKPQAEHKLMKIQDHQAHPLVGRVAGSGKGKASFTGQALVD